MEPDMGAEGPVRGQNEWAGDDACRGSDVEHVGAFAAQVLEDLYGLVYGERPVGVRVWCDGSALLMVVRLAGPLDDGDGEAELGTMLPSECIPELVATAVRAQMGWGLSLSSSSVESELGLVMFVFRLPDDPPARARVPEFGGGLLATSAELEARRALRLQSTHVPSWRAWSPLPGRDIAADGAAASDRRRLHIVED
jgi:hypothetical protein